MAPNVLVMTNPFRIEIPQTDLDDLHRRLAEARFADPVPGDEPDWSRGIPTAAVYQLCNAGDEIWEIAEEYDRQPSEIEAAIRYESVRARRAA